MRREGSRICIFDVGGSENRLAQGIDITGIVVASGIVLCDQFSRFAP